MAEYWDKMTQILQSLLDSQEWPNVSGPKDKPIWIENVENASTQVEAYWYYVVEGKTKEQVAEVQKITPKAAWKRIEKIRNWISCLLTERYDADSRLKSCRMLQAHAGLSYEDAMRAMALNEHVLRKFKKRGIDVQR